MQRIGPLLCQVKKLYMLRLFISIFILTTTIVLGGCKKDKTTVNTQLKGSWELTEAQTGMVPSLLYPPGNGNTLFFSDSSYQKYTDNVLESSGRYSIVTDTTASQTVGLVIPAGQYNRRIIFEGMNSNYKVFFQLSGNSLSLLTGYFPLDSGGYLVYKKVN